jgi:hypothetical protein
MSYTVSIDVDSSRQLASNRGYDDLCDWIDGLDPERYPALTYLRNEGWFPKTFPIADELSEAIKSDPPKPSVQKTVRTLLSFIEPNDPDGVLVISQ